MKNKGSVEQQSVKSSSITSDTVSIASCFSKLSMASKRIINKAYSIDAIQFGQDINWLDLPKDKMPNYKYSEFDWSSSHKLKDKVNDQVKKSADTKATLSHLLKEINLFLEIYNGSSVDSLFIKIENVSLSSEYDLQLNGFETYGRTDLLISPSHEKDVLDMNYCNIQLKSVANYKHERSDEIFKSSDADCKRNQEKLTAESLAELLGSIPLSKCPIMQFTTDLDQNFHIMFFYEDNKDNGLQLHHYNLSGTEAIATLAVWLIYFCPHLLYSETIQPKTKDLKLLENIQRAHQNIKKMISSNSLDIPIKHNLELNSVTDNLPICLKTEQDYKIKCQKWVDSLSS